MSGSSSATSSASSDWNGYAKARAAAGRGAHFDRATMALGDAAHDRQPQPVAALRSRRATIQAVKGLEDALPFGGGNARTVVIDVEAESVGALLRGELDPRGGGAPRVAA